MTSLETRACGHSTGLSILHHAAISFWCHIIQNNIRPISLYHLQPLFQMWNSGLKPVFCFKVDGMSVLSWSPSPSLGLLWLCWTPSLEQAFGSCSVLRSEDSLRKGPCEHWGVYLHARVCAYLWCMFFSSITPPANFQLFHSLCSLSLNKFIPILWNISSLNPQECSDSIWASGIS